MTCGSTGTTTDCIANDVRLAMDWVHSIDLVSGMCVLGCGHMSKVGVSRGVVICSHVGVSRS